MTACASALWVSAWKQKRPVSSLDYSSTAGASEMKASIRDTTVSTGLCTQLRYCHILYFPVASCIVRRAAGDYLGVNKDIMFSYSGVLPICSYLKKKKVLYVIPWDRHKPETTGNVKIVGGKRKMGLNIPINNTGFLGLLLNMYEWNWPLEWVAGR